MINSRFVPLVKDLANALSAEIAATRRREAAETKVVKAIEACCENPFLRRMALLSIRLTIATLLRRPPPAHGPGRVTVEFHIGPITEQ